MGFWGPKIRELQILAAKKRGLRSPAALQVVAAASMEPRRVQRPLSSKIIEKHTSSGPRD